MSAATERQIRTRPTALSVPDLQDWLDEPEGPRLIDVRTPAEFATVHVPGSYNVPLDLVKEHRAELRAHLLDHVVLICRSGNRADQAEKALVELGAELPQLHVLAGGLTAWEIAGGAVNRGVQKWELERQVRLVAGSIVFGSVLASVVVPKAKWLAAGIGGGLATAAVTNSCLLGMALARLPYNREQAPTMSEVLSQLRSDDARS